MNARLLNRRSIVNKEHTFIALCTDLLLAFLGAGLWCFTLRIGVLADEVVHLLVLLTIRWETLFHVPFESIIDELESTEKKFEILGNVRVLTDLDLLVINQLVPCTLNDVPFIDVERAVEPSEVQFLRWHWKLVFKND